jgi:hypothetical protein
MIKNSGIRITELRDNRKNYSVFEIPPYHPSEGFNCSGGSFVALEKATGTIKASFP